MSGKRRDAKGSSTTKRLVVALALAIGALPLLPGVALAHHAEIGGTIDCASVVSWTATAWNGSTEAERTNPNVSVWYTVDGGAPQGTTGGAFNLGNGFQFSGTFNVPATGAIRLFAQDLGAWGNGTPPSGNAFSFGPLSRPTNCGPSVHISKSASAQTANPGDTVTFTIQVSNTGSGPANDVVVTDSLPQGFSIVSTSGPGCGSSGANVTCNVGTLAAGASATITITATVTPRACPNRTNTANVAWTDGQQVPGSAASNPVVVTVNCAPSIQISKSGPASVGQGGTVTYTISVSNNGTAPAQNVVVTDGLDAVYTNVSGSWVQSSNGGTCSVNGTNVSCNLGTLGDGKTATITITATAPTGSCPEIDNVASVQAGTQPAQQSNVVTTQVTGCAPDVDITKSASAQSVNPGGSFTYSVQVANGGNAPATGVVVTDSVPAGLTITNVSGPGCSFTGQNVTCNVGSLAAGASASITITVQATAQACPSVVNSAHVQWTGAQQAPGSADSNQVTVAVNCTPGISITKSASSVTVSPGGSFTYSVQVANGGNAPATGVVVTDSVPAGLTITNVSGPGCSFTGQNVTCNVGSLAAGASASITITVQATAQACPSVVNSAHVVYQGGQGTASASSNAVTVGVSCSPDLQIVKNSDAPAGGVDSGDSFSYTITVTNGGNASASGVVVSDQIPAGLRIDGVTGPGCSVNGHLVTCNVGTLAAGSSVTITIHVTAKDAACPAVENAATVTWGQGGQATSRNSNTVDVDVDCVRGETITPTPEPSDPPTTVTPPGGVAFTGPQSNAIRLGFLAIALLVLGTGLMLAGYRRRARGEA